MNPKGIWQLIAVSLKRRVTLNRYRRAVTQQYGDGLKARSRAHACGKGRARYVDPLIAQEQIATCYGADSGSCPAAGRSRHRGRRAGVPGRATKAVQRARDARGRQAKKIGAPTSRNRQQTRDTGYRNDNKAADHGERVFVNFPHAAPHRNIARPTGL
jgi:hypothetical protein